VPVLDTTAEAALVQTEAQRRLGVAGRFRIAVEMSDLTRELARAGLRARHPEIHEKHLDTELIREIYGFEAETQ
jgi:hypothetical protein